MSLTRVTVTALALAGVVATGVQSARRITGSVLRARAEDRFGQGRLLEAADLYRSAHRWDPLAASASTDEADTLAYALAYRVDPLRDRPDEAPAVAGRALGLFAASAAAAPPGPWSWAEAARVYEALATYRPLLEEIDLSTISADPMLNLRAEDRLAEAALLRALAYEPRNYFYLDSLGELYWRVGWRPRAREVFRRAVEIYPVVEGHYYLGAVAERDDELALAVQSGLESAREGVGKAERWVVSRELGHLARLRRRPSEALAAYRLALQEGQRAPANHRAALHFYVATLLQDAGRLDEAAGELEAAIALAPERPHLYGALGVLLGRLDRHAEAMAALGRARALAPLDPAIVRRIAEECRRAGDMDGAERAYRDLIRLLPDREEPYQLVIGLFRDAGMQPRAIPYARELARLRPDEPLYQEQLRQLYEDEVGR